MLALILTRKLRPMICGSSSWWLMLAGITARPRATSSRTNSGVTKAGNSAPKLSPSASAAWARASCSWRPMFSRWAMNTISLVTMPARAYSSCVSGWSGDRPAQWRRLVGKVAGEVLAGGIAVVLRLDVASGIGLDVAALGDPWSANARQALLDVDLGIGLGVGPGWVIDAERRLAARFVQRDFAITARGRRNGRPAMNRPFASR